MITKLDLELESYGIPELSDQYVIPETLAANIKPLGKPLQTRAAFAFERKGYISLDELGRERNPTYSADLDSFIVQETWLVTANYDSWTLLKQAHNIALYTAKEQKREALLAEQARIAKELEGLEK